MSIDLEKEFLSYFKKKAYEGDETVMNILKMLVAIPDAMKRGIEEMAAIGWFPTTFSYPNKMYERHLTSREAIDEYMINDIDVNLEKIEVNIIEKYPARSEVISMAFQLHKERNWIASIPLLLAQTDGICAQNLGAFLFSEHEKREASIKEKFKNNHEEVINYLVYPFTMETQFGAGISKKSSNHKINGPNRNGVLHGSRKHLDYASEINSAKSISLLSFICMQFEVSKPI